MQRLALPTAAVVITSIIAPAAQAATMAETYEPHFGTEAKHVYAVKGDGYSTTAEFDLQGAPEGTTWRLTGETTDRHLFRLFEGERLGAQLNHSGKEPPHRGENSTTIDVRVTYPDGTTELVYPEISLIPDDAFLFRPEYDNYTPADPGETVTIEPSNHWKRIPLPGDATWSLKGGEALNARIDEKTGIITATVPKDSYSGASFEVRIDFADESFRTVYTEIRNTGVGVVAKQTPAPAPEPEPVEPAGSTPLQKAALMVGILAVIAGIGALAMPYLPL